MSGIVKSITNYFTGTLANRISRKNLLTIGWLIGMPAPFILMFTNHWKWIVAANILLGINQGLTWSSTVVMKIDLVGERHRGFASIRDLRIHFNNRIAYGILFPHYFLPHEMRQHGPFTDEPLTVHVRLRTHCCMP